MYPPYKKRDLSVYVYIRASSRITLRAFENEYLLAGSFLRCSSRHTDNMLIFMF